MEALGLLMKMKCRGLEYDDALYVERMTFPSVGAHESSRADVNNFGKKEQRPNIYCSSTTDGWMYVRTYGNTTHIAKGNTMNRHGMEDGVI